MWWEYTKYPHDDDFQNEDVEKYHKRTRRKPFNQDAEGEDTIFNDMENFQVQDDKDTSQSLNEVSSHQIKMNSSPQQSKLNSDLNKLKDLSIGTPSSVKRRSKSNDLHEETLVKLQYETNFNIESLGDGNAVSPEDSSDNQSNKYLENELYKEGLDPTQCNSTMNTLTVDQHDELTAPIVTNDKQNNKKDVNTLQLDNIPNFNSNIALDKKTQSEFQVNISLMHSEDNENRSTKTNNNEAGDKSSTVSYETHKVQNANLKFTNTNTGDYTEPSVSTNEITLTSVKSTNEMTLTSARSTNEMTLISAKSTNEMTLTLEKEKQQSIVEKDETIDIPPNKSNITSSFVIGNENQKDFERNVSVAHSTFINDKHETSINIRSEQLQKRSTFDNIIETDEQFVSTGIKMYPIDPYVKLKLDIDNVEKLQETDSNNNICQLQIHEKNNHDRETEVTRETDYEDINNIGDTNDNYFDVDNNIIDVTLTDSRASVSLTVPNTKSHNFSENQTVPAAARGELNNADVRNNISFKVSSLPVSDKKTELKNIVRRVAKTPTKEKIAVTKTVNVNLVKIEGMVFHDSLISDADEDDSQEDTNNRYRLYHELKVIDSSLYDRKQRLTEETDKNKIIENLVNAKEIIDVDEIAHRRFLFKKHENDNETLTNKSSIETQNNAEELIDKDEIAYRRKLFKKQELDNTTFALSNIECQSGNIDNEINVDVISYRRNLFKKSEVISEHLMTSRYDVTMDGDLGREETSCRRDLYKKNKTLTIDCEEVATRREKFLQIELDIQQKEPVKKHKLTKIKHVNDENEFLSLLNKRKALSEAEVQEECV